MLVKAISTRDILLVQGGVMLVALYVIVHDFRSAPACTRLKDWA